MTRTPDVIRRASASLLVLWLGVLVVSFAIRQWRRPTPQPLPEVGSDAAQGQEPALRVHKGFVYSDTVGIEPNFRIAARETFEFASGRLELHDVEVTLYDRGEVAYGMVAETARLYPSRREAEALGNAQLSLGGGIAARANGFVLKGAARLFESTGQVAFAGRGWGGTASVARGSLADNTITLDGGVSVVFRRGEAPTVLLAPTAHYDRRRATLELPQGLDLLWGDLLARAPRASLLLAAPEGEVRRLLLEEPVSVAGHLGDGTELSFSSGRVEISGLGPERLRFVAEAAPSGWASLHWQDAVGTLWELAAYRLTGEVEKRGASWVEGQGLACLSQAGAGPVARRVEAHDLRVELVDGRPAGAIASDEVRLGDGSNWAEGDTFQYSRQTDSYTLGGGKSRVRLGGAAFTATCDAVEGGRDGSIVARGRVVGRVERSSAADPKAPPVNFASDRVSTARQGEDPIILEGDARLWQGERLIRAERLEYRRRNGALRGSGQVITVATFDRGSEGVEEATVRARAVTYEQPAGEVSYEGDVQLVNPQATIDCQRLVARMDGAGTITHAVLSGGVRIVDTATGRAVEGQRAEFDPAADVLDIWGMPVLVRESAGNQLKASHFRWYRATGTFVVVGEEDNPTEALYHAPGGGRELPVVQTPAPQRRRP